MISAFSFVLLVLASVASCAQHPILANEPAGAFAGAKVGIALTIDHATISVRFENGSFADLGSVEANDEYKTVMWRLSSPSAWHPHPPYQSIGEQWNDAPRQFWRAVRKRLGRPASYDVSVISQMLEDIAAIAAPYVYPLQSAIISYPALPALYQEDIADAAFYRGIDLLPSMGWCYEQPWELVAAYAGHGLGLCKNYDDAAKCLEEEEKLPKREVVLFEYTETALLLHATPLSKVWVDTEVPPKVATSFDMGSAHNVSETRIRDFVLGFMRDKIGCWEGTYPFHCPEKVTVIMTGNPASYSDGIAEKAIVRAIRMFGSEPELFSSKHDYVAARGAAEMTSRAFRPHNKLCEF